MLMFIFVAGKLVKCDKCFASDDKQRNVLTKNCRSKRQRSNLSVYGGSITSVTSSTLLLKPNIRFLHADISKVVNICPVYTDDANGLSFR